MRLDWRSVLRPVTWLGLLRRQVRSDHSVRTVGFAVFVATIALLVYRGVPELEGFFYDMALAAPQHLRIAEPQPVEHVSLAVFAGQADEAPPDADIWAEAIQALLDGGAAGVVVDLSLPRSESGPAQEEHARLVSIASRYRQRVIFADRPGPKSPAVRSVFETVAFGLMPQPATFAPFLADDDIIRRLPASAGGTQRHVIHQASALHDGSQDPPRRSQWRPRQHPSGVPVHDVQALMACAADQAAPLGAVEGKVVFLSLAEPAFDDAAHAARFMPHVTDHSEPADCAGSLHAAGEELAGLQLLAGLTESRLGGDWSEPSGRLLPLVLGIIAAALGSLVTLILAPMPAFLASLALPLAIFIVSIQTIHHGLYFAETVAMFTGPLAMVLCLGFQKLGEERAKQQAEGAFGRYLPPHLLREFAEGRAELEPGGAERRVTVMFADLAGFTALSDRLEAPALLKVVNRYLGMVVAEVEDHRGYVDKFMGDAVMALWGAPISNQQPEYYACLAAIATQEVIDQARARDEDSGEKGFGIKIGIASGPVVVGNVGTETRLSYTAIGQTVNIASRLETLVPVYRCGTIVDSATATGAREDILFRELDRVIVRGARQPIAIYQPVALRANVTADQKKKLDSYAVALARYRARRFQDALDIWRSWAEVDPPSAVMAEEASRLLRDPPRPTWDAARRINRK